MSSQFRNQFRRSAAPSLVRQFGEEVLYYPRGGSVCRTIKAIVERSEELVENGIAQMVMVRVINDCTLGISATEIDDGRDEVAVALIEGGSLERRQIVRMTDDSNGMVRFRVR